ncbi:hypothetical protein [Muriicola sp.]|uniref:hypothetical protein n=1 Tax=Muriicola sp. TaxID=2020856 RepID=UPI003C71A945
MTGSEIKEGKTTAIVAYITIVGALIAISMNSEPKNAYARHHTRQAFGLHLVFLGCALFLSVWFSKYAWLALYTFHFAMWFYGFLGAVSGKLNLLPVIGPYFQKWFTFIQ